MYHSLDFLDLLQLDLKLHSIFPTFTETKSLITIQNRGKEKELDKNKSWYVPWQPPFCFFTLYFLESSDDPIPYEAKATSKVQVVNFCLSLFFLGSQTKIRVPRKSWQKFFLLTKQFLLMTYRVSDPSCGTVSKYDLFCCWEIKGRERKRKRKKKSRNLGNTHLKGKNILASLWFPRNLRIGKYRFSRQPNGKKKC